VPKGEHLCRQEEPQRFLYFLVKGKLEVDYLQLDGSHSVFSFETPLSIIGDLELICAENTISNVFAIEDSFVLAATMKTIRNYGMNDPFFLQFIIEYLSRKLRFSTFLLSQAAQSMNRRLAHYLLLRMRKEGTKIKLENRESMAAILGVSVRHLNRTLREIASAGIIAIHNKTLTIVNSQSLSSILEERT